MWYKMLYCLQFGSLRKAVESFESDPMEHGKEIDSLYDLAQKYSRIRYVYKKSRVMLKKYEMRFRR